MDKLIIGQISHVYSMLEKSMDTGVHITLNKEAITFCSQGYLPLRIFYA